MSNERLMRITVLLEDRLFHVISVYAPTFRASEHEKEKFMHSSSICVKNDGLGRSWSSWATLMHGLALVTMRGWEPMHQVKNKKSLISCWDDLGCLS